MGKYDFSGKNVIVTGGTSGIGYATIQAFAEAGANVVIADLDQEKADDVAKEMESRGVKAIGFAVDVRDHEKLQELVKKTTKELGSLDCFVNCAGIGGMRPIEEFTKDSIDAIIDIDLKGTIYGCKAALDYMKPRKEGKIVNMSSVASRLCLTGAGMYSAAKAGVNALTASLAREAGPLNINVNAIMPGVIRTNMWEETLEEWAGDDMEKRAEIFASFTKDVPMGRPQEVEEIANMVLFLCSEDGKNINGQSIAIDGAMTVGF